MRIDLYTVCWDEADLLPSFFGHYDPWVDRYVVFDDGSTDGSVELLDAHPRVERRALGRSAPGSFVLSQTALQDEVWKASRGRADWVIVTAIDEHLWCPRAPLPELLAELGAQAVTAVPALGYQVVSDAPPEPGEPLVATRTRGAPFGEMNKLSVFRPDALADTRFGPGRHWAAPTGAFVVPRRDELLLSHVKLLGFERVLARNAHLRSGLGPVDRERAFGEQYDRDRAALRATWDAFEAEAVDLAAPGLDAHATHPVPRWWR